MLIQWLLASAHLLGLGVGLGAIWARARALGGEFDAPARARALTADNWWGIASLIWIPTGLVRAFGGFEKGAEYYLHNWAFLVKMGLLGVLLLLEIWPMVTFIRWRIQEAKGQTPDTARAKLFSTFSYVEAACIVAMVFAAAAMARGLGSP